MVTRAAPKQVDPGATQNLTRSLEKLATKKIWLPRLLYDSLPYFYLVAGMAAFFAALYISEWFWVVPQYILFSAACLHLAFAVFRRRRKVHVDKLDETIVFAPSQGKR
ncbi:MAG TPA: hypothetical protein VKZ91_08440 [Woeseiaceae bacterium]|nr:hypothetical protein [Woeseiaceae bacterium]